MHPRRRITMAAVAAGLVLSGCTEPRAEAEPTAPSGTVEGTVEASPTPSPSPSAAVIAPPEPPADLARTDDTGAAAAATYFLSLYSYTMQSGDIAEWDAMSAASCGFCTKTRELALSIKDSGETFRGAEIAVSSTVVHPLDTLVGAYPVDLVYTQAGSEHRRSDGSLKNSSVSTQGTLGVDIALIEESWKVLAVTAQDGQ